MQHRFSSVAILLVAGVFVSAEAPRGALVPTTTDPAGLVVHEWAHSPLSPLTMAQPWNGYRNSARRSCRASLNG